MKPPSLGDQPIIRAYHDLAIDFDDQDLAIRSHPRIDDGQMDRISRKTIDCTLQSDRTAEDVMPGNLMGHIDQSRVRAMS